MVLTAPAACPVRVIRCIVESRRRAVLHHGRSGSARRSRIEPSNFGAIKQEPKILLQPGGKRLHSIDKVPLLCMALPPGMVLDNTRNRVAVNLDDLSAVMKNASLSYSGSVRKKRLLAWLRLRHSGSDFAELIKPAKRTLQYWFSSKRQLYPVPHRPPPKLVHDPQLERRQWAGLYRHRLRQEHETSIPVCTS